MITRSITILSPVTCKKPPAVSAAAFSIAVTERMPKQKNVSGRTSLFFRKRPKSVSVQHLAVQKQQRVHYHYNRRFHTVSALHFSPVMKLSHQTAVSTEQVKSDLHHHDAAAVSNLRMQFAQHRTSVRNFYRFATGAEAADRIVTAVEPLVFKSHRDRRETYRSHEEHRVLVTGLREQTEQFSPETLVYKSQKRQTTFTEEQRRKQLQSKEEHHRSTLINESRSVTREERVKEKRELEAISEKVYTLVMKKYERERRRRGELYGR